VGEQGTEDEVHLVLGRELLDHLGAALRIRPVVFRDDLDRPAADTALLVDELDGRRRRALVPATVDRADPGPVNLEAEPERRRLRGRAGRPWARKLRAHGQGAARRQESPSGDLRCAPDGLIHGWSS
jgi:hypothetical protein